MRAFERSLVRLGLAGAVLTFVVLAGLNAWTTPLFAQSDEASHYGYALLVSAGPREDGWPWSPLPPRWRR